MADCIGKPDVQASNDITSEIEYEDNDFGMNTFVNELVQTMIEGVTQDIADERTAQEIVTFNFDKLALEKTGYVSMESVSSGSSHVDNNTPVRSGSEGESDFEEFLVDRQSSTNKLLRSINKLERTTLPLTRRAFSETNATMAKLNLIISSEHEGRGQGISSSTLHSEIPRVGSVSSIREMFEVGKMQLSKAASDTSAANFRCSPTIMDFPELKFDKLNYSIAQSDKVRSLNHPTSQSDKVVNELTQLFESKEREKLNRNIRLTQDELKMATIGSSIMSDASLKSCSIVRIIFEKVKQIPGDIDIVTNIPNDTSLMVNVPVVNATPVPTANVLQQQVACKINKKPSFVKRATSRISGAIRGMTRLFTSCGSSRRGTGRNANSVPPNNILH